jgi:hypothetical protein
MNKPTLAVFLLAINLMAANVTGRWSGRFRVDGGDHDIPQLLILKQEGNKLIGSGGPNDTEQYPIEDGKVNGDRVQFEITTGEWKFTYDVKADGATMKGNIELKSVNDQRTALVSLTKTQ